ncbi:unnamed protein product [Oppiella nova]|uniref:VIT family protein n=1 Tax=Oppiella nova TaxID=334625 RepID=A0A7R9LBX3_9ACAR|nr:unnamed protein product [Oppiella nova]CAG2162022.1 unnamed protein product [Oppiella nova]
MLWMRNGCQKCFSVLSIKGWLRAAVLGANDGIISVTSLVMGMAASGASSHTLLITCIAGLISGATSMAAGEYISVKSQSDIEAADLKVEARELEKNPHLELKELTHIYIQRGLDPELAHQVAVQLTEKDALEAHARDEIGINEATAARPLQAAVVGILSLVILGALSSYFAGTSILKGSFRVAVWGIIAMAFSSWIGSLFQVTPM